MTLRAALDLLIQVAAALSAALSAAHEASIIHRDIKPENLMLRRDGIVEERSDHLLSLRDPIYDPLRADPRFAELVRGIGLTQ